MPTSEERARQEIDSLLEASGWDVQNYADMNISAASQCGVKEAMPIYELTNNHIRSIEETTFADAGISERGDLQRLLREQVEVISPDTLVIMEEFGEWEESRRRIDLLGIDKDANLIVIELKRTEDGGHMELQAIRYAAMVSTMTFDKVVEVFGNYLKRLGQEADSRETILEFLGWEEPDEDLFAQDVRIVLASAEFSRELTTAVMWLNDRDIDVRCVRIKPYQDGERLFLDVQQVIPLPEAAEYQVHIREKERKERKDRAERYGLRKKFWAGLLQRAKPKTTLHANISASEYHWLGTGSGMSGLNFNYTVNQHGSNAALYVDRGAKSDRENKAIFDILYAAKDEVESVFGEPLEWQRMDDKRASRIKKSFALGGYRDTEDKWSEIHDKMISAMIRLDKSLRPEIEKLKHQKFDGQHVVAHEPIESFPA